MSRRQSANGFVDGVLRSRAPGMQKEIADKFSIQFVCGARRTMESIQRVAERKHPFLGAIVESPATHRIAEAMKLSGTSRRGSSRTSPISQTLPSSVTGNESDWGAGPVTKSENANETPGWRVCCLKSGPRNAIARAMHSIAERLA